MLKIFSLSQTQVVPRKGTVGSAGYDLFAAESINIEAGSRALVSVGIKIAIGIGYYGRVASRSSLACKGIDVGAGVIDSDYRGVVKVLLINNSNSEFTVCPGDAIAQLILERIYTCDPEIVTTESELGSTDRGAGGFGSTNSRSSL